MPHYEFYCEECRAYWELSIEQALDPTELLCVNCATPSPRLAAIDHESSTRLNNVVGAMAEIINRVEILEENLDTGSDAPKTKSKKPLN